MNLGITPCANELLRRSDDFFHRNTKYDSPNNREGHEVYWKLCGKQTQIELM